MTGNSRLSIGRGAATLIAAGLLLAGAGVTYVLLRSRAPADATATKTSAESAPPAAVAPPPLQTPASADTVSAPLPDVAIPLSPDAVQRAGVVVAPVGRGSSATELRLPGVVEPHGYRQVVVTPLVGGRVTEVSAELGQRVRRGQALAQIYSPQLAEMQSRYVSARAMLDAHDRELRRTEKLAAIGAASRQEIERLHAEHAAQTAAVQTSKTELELLGVPASTIDALDSGKSVSAAVTVPAPIDGVVTARTANAGLNVDATTPLLIVVDLSTVWVVADVYEVDFSRVHVGSEAVVTTSAYRDLALRGRVSYIDPQVNPSTRTAKVRVEVPNPRGELRLGMYAEALIAGATRDSVPMIPRSAVQTVGDRTVVYVAVPAEPGRFIEREVRLGPTSGDRVEVIAGVQPGDAIVTDGSFSLRAERERLGLRRVQSAEVQTVRIVLNERGYDPASVAVRAGTRARVTFVRVTDKTCGTEIVFPSLNIKRALPLNEPVAIEFTPEKTGELAFVCGMNMLKGSVVVK
jgi:RND family efflux transporter MFP subunit